MKFKLFILALLCSLMLVSCGGKQDIAKTYSPEINIISEEPSIGAPHLVIVFNYTYDFEKPSADSGLSLEEIQEQLKQDRKKAKEFYSKKNKEYLSQLDLKFKSSLHARISISNYTNMIFIHFADNATLDDVQDIIVYLNSKEIVASAYFNEG